MLERRRTGVTRVTADPPGRLQDGSCSWLGLSPVIGNTVLGC